MPVLRRRLPIVLLAACAAAGSLRSAANGSIRGTVSVPAAIDLERPTPGALAAPHHDTPDRRRAVVYLDGDTVPRQAMEDVKPMRARMDQRGEQFVPRVLAVTVGASVEFPNNDTTFHNVFSLSRVKTFDLGRYRPGRTGSVTFDRPGIVPIFCDIHAHMSAYVLVFSHPFFAVTDADGRYTIANVPPGPYTLMVWSELGSAAPRHITVLDGEITEADFRIGRQR